MTRKLDLEEGDILTTPSGTQYKLMQTSIEYREYGIVHNDGWRKQRTIKQYIRNNEKQLLIGFAFGMTLTFAVCITIYLCFLRKKNRGFQ